jgi:hypothetical protein
MRSQGTSPENLGIYEKKKEGLNMIKRGNNIREEEEVRKSGGEGKKSKKDF